MKITKQRLKEIIKEELNETIPASIRADVARPAGVPRALEEDELDGDTFEMSVDQLEALASRGFRKIEDGLLDFGSAQARLVELHDGGEFVHLRTKKQELDKLVYLLKEAYTIALGNFIGRQ